ncbi:MAG: O-antigen ligase family protein [Polyangiaceae bacterium]|nr:O-antigen ligase family protein [Polyangiaceae bacterium]
MYALPGVMLLVIFIYGRPQEWDPRFESLPFLYLWLALAFVGMAIDVGTGKTRLKSSPHLKWGMALYFWCLITLGLRNPGDLKADFVPISVTLVLFYLIGHSVWNFKGFTKLIGTVFAMGLFVATVAVHQGFSPYECIEMIPIEGARADTGVPNGVPCETYRDCREAPNADPATEYLCERIGLFKTTTITGGRVRWRGVLQDPNELALTTGIVLPFAFALFEIKRSFGRLLVLLYSLIIIGTAVVLTQSRGGQLVFSTVIGVYFIKKYGVRGAIIGALFAAPLIMLGGRGSQEAADSANERTEILVEGLKIWRAFPLMGCGYRQFTEHHWLTAHNAYLLALAELGPFGLFAWTTMIYSTLKVSFTAMGRYARVTAAYAAPIRAWAMAILAGFCGMMIGIFFLSFTYHYVLWIYFGLSAAFYCAVRGTDPGFEVRIEGKDFKRIALLDLAIVLAIFAITKKGGH